MTNVRAWLFALALCAVAGPLLLAADAQQAFDNMFGDEIKKAATSPQASGAFANKLLSKAKELTDDPQFRVLLLIRASEYGAKDPSGMGAAAEALKLLIEALPDRKDEFQGKLTELRQLRYQRSTGADRALAGRQLIAGMIHQADDLFEKDKLAEAAKVLRQAQTIAQAVKSIRLEEVTWRLASVTARQDAQTKADQLKAKVKADASDDASAKALVVLCLADLDDPDQASNYTQASNDEAMKTFVPLAMKKVADVPEGSAIDLAEWYEKLSANASPNGKFNLLTRAKNYYTRYLAMHAQKDAANLKAAMALEAVTKALEKMPQSNRRELTMNLGSGVTLKLALLPTGKFMMGSPKDDRTFGETRHEVKITRLMCMAVTETTQEQYAVVIGKNPSHTKNQPKFPVEDVTWNNANEYCQKLSQATGEVVRLPTEAEWEYACRAGSNDRYCFGDDEKALTDYAWYTTNSDKKTHSVATKKPNAWGLFDMHGNVEEWCSDYFDPDYYRNSPAADPAGPDRASLGNERIYRGGSCRRDGWDCRAATRNGTSPDRSSSDMGFRVVIDLE